LSAFAGTRQNERRDNVVKYSRVIFGIMVAAFSLILIAGWFIAPNILIQIRDFLHSIEGVITAAATVAVALFTWTLWQSSEKMWQVTKVAAEAAQKSADTIPNIERAYVFIEARVSQRSVTQMMFEYSLHNHGKTPAIIKSIDIRTEMAKTGPDNTVHRPTETKDEHVIAASGHWGPLHKRHDYDAKADGPALSKRDKFVWLYGSILYDDVFGIERVTRFRWRIKDWDKQRFQAEGGKPFNERT
jgi:hypothetical protein